MYPCEQYIRPSGYASFITKQNQLSDMKKMEQIGAEAYAEEQKEKISILNELLEQYNDGRKKMLYTLVVNLLNIEALRQVMSALRSYNEKTDVKAEAVYATVFLQEKANESEVELKLRRKGKHNYG